MEKYNSSNEDNTEQYSIRAATLKQILVTIEFRLSISSALHDRHTTMLILFVLKTEGNLLKLLEFWNAYKYLRFRPSLANCIMSYTSCNCR